MTGNFGGIYYNIYTILLFLQFSLLHGDVKQGMDICCYDCILLFKNLIQGRTVLEYSVRAQFSKGTLLNTQDLEDFDSIN